MAIVLRSIFFPPFRDLSFQIESGVVSGIIGIAGSGISQLLKLIAGKETPQKGEILVPEPCILAGPFDAFPDKRPSVLALDFNLDTLDPFEQRLALKRIESWRRLGTTVVLASFREELLTEIADEVIWLHAGQLKDRGHPKRVLDAFRQYICDRLLAWGLEHPPTLDPLWRRSDGVARVTSLKVLNAKGNSTSVVRSGELITIEVQTEFNAPVARPMVGILIRDRIGLEVYGTNTGLEQIDIPRADRGAQLVVSFTFACNLCPGMYTVTAALQEIDGLWHDWLEQAISFSVIDTRHTAGVANLKAQVRYRWL